MNSAMQSQAQSRKHLLVQILKPSRQLQHKSHIRSRINLCAFRHALPMHPSGHKASCTQCGRHPLTNCRPSTMQQASALVRQPSPHERHGHADASKRMSLRAYAEGVRGPDSSISQINWARFFHPSNQLAIPKRNTTRQGKAACHFCRRRGSIKPPIKGGGRGLGCHKRVNMEGQWTETIGE